MHNTFARLFVVVAGYTVSDIRKLYLEFKGKVFEGKTPYKADNLEECLKDFFTEDTTLDKHKYPK